MSSGIGDLQDAVDAAVGNWAAAQDGGGITTGYILAFECLDGDGTHNVVVVNPNTQPTHRSMGILKMADEMYNAEARMMIAQFFLDGPDE